jgi:hypothetical protein
VGENDVLGCSVHDKAESSTQPGTSNLNCIDGAYVNRKKTEEPQNSETPQILTASCYTCIPALVDALAAYTDISRAYLRRHFGAPEIPMAFPEQ